MSLLFGTLPSSMVNLLFFSSLRRAIALCVPCFSDLLRFLKLLLLIFFYQSSFWVSSKIVVYFFWKVQKISLILLFLWKELFVFPLFVISCFVSLFFMQELQKTFRYFLGCQLFFFWKYLVSSVLIPLFLFKNISPQFFHSLYFLLNLLSLGCTLFMSALLVVTVFFSQCIFAVVLSMFLLLMFIDSLLCFFCFFFFAKPFFESLLFFIFFFEETLFSFVHPFL